MLYCAPQINVDKMLIQLALEVVTLQFSEFVFSYVVWLDDW